ncbi:MAG: PorV/PorQ family protein [Bacteroidota bacterium]
MFKNLLHLTSIILITVSTIIMGQAGEEDFARLNYSDDVTKTGTSAANFLEIGIGATAQALGGAYSSLASNATALYWNPAGISNLTKIDITLNHAVWLADTKHQYFGLVFPFGNGIAIGISYTGLNYGSKRPVRTIMQPDGTGEFYSAVDMALSSSIAMQVTDRFSFGITGKYIEQKIWHESASAFAVDVGVLYKTQLEGLNIGTSISNFGSDMKMDGRDLVRAFDADSKNYSNDKLNVSLKTDSFPLPLIFRFGLSYQFMIGSRNGFTFAADMVHPSNNNIYVNSGFEFNFSNLIQLRLGYESLFDQTSEKGLTAGFGIVNPFENTIAFTINYAYSDWGRLGYVQRFSVNIGF